MIEPRTRCAPLPTRTRACPSSAFLDGRSRVNPTSAGEGLGVGLHQRITARPPPRRFAIADASHRRSSHQERRPKAAYALPTRGRVGPSSLTALIALPDTL